MAKKPNTKIKKRNEEIFKLHQDGIPAGVISAKFNIPKQSIYQLIYRTKKNKTKKTQNEPQQNPMSFWNRLMCYIKAVFSK